MQQDSIQVQDTALLLIHPDSLIAEEDSLPVKNDTSSTVFSLFFGDSTKFNPIPNKVYKSDQKSLFNTQNPVSGEYKMTVRQSYNTDWITIHLVICLVLTAWVQIYYGKRLRQIIRAFTGIRFTSILSKEGNLFRERISIPLFIIYLVSISLLIYQVAAGQSTSGIEGLKFFSVIILAVLMLWFIKNVLVRFAGKIFKNQVILTDYMHTNFIFNMVSGLLFLPFIVVSVYLPSATAAYAGIAIWLIIFLYRFVRELFTGLTYTKFSLFSRILYLCTFEIIPFLVFTKLVMSYLS